MDGSPTDPASGGEVVELFATNTSNNSDDLVAGVLRLVRLWVPARAVALFEFVTGSTRLAAADLIDQGTLWDAELLAARPPLGLREGAAFRGRGHGGRGFLVLPCRVHEGGPLRGLLYIELNDAAEIRPLRPLRALAEMLAAALAPGDSSVPAEPPRPVAAPLAPAAAEPEALPHEPQNANLVFLLEHNEWNVSRVARILGVTRMTIYNRLRRAGVGRKRVPKATPSGA
jgi:hypothetical protein